LINILFFINEEGGAYYPLINKSNPCMQLSYNTTKPEENMRKITTITILFVIASTLLASCGPKNTTSSDLLSQIQQRGTILVSTDPNYEPQSFLNTEGKRPSDTKCPSETLTSAEMQGFDVDVALEIGKRLGVEVCFATPDWDMITAGNWADKWDISVGSMTIKPARQAILEFTTPYYYTPAMIGTLKDSGINSIADLAGQAICVGTATTYDDWLMGVLDLPASSIYSQPPADIKVVPLPTDQECAQALAAGRTDFVAYVTSDTVLDANIAAGMPIVKVGKAVFSEDLGIAIDKAHSLPTATLLKAVDDIVIAMHTDGTLSQLSINWFGADLTQDPSK
jgi:polar amino acid transport system substrate-binding protein